MAITFYGTRGEHGGFSNFSAHPFEVDGFFWPTSEHYFQAQKFEDEEYREKIRTTKSAMIAARLGRSRAVPIRADWDDVKDEVMLRAVRAKFAHHKALADELLATGDEEIIEKTTRDKYWGCGTDGTGLNKLGLILMQVRGELRVAAGA